MVKKGQFGLQLVDASTPEVPFKEHTTNDGTTYIEVEPDTEYFLKVSIDSDRDSVIYAMQVDGEDLGYWVENEKDQELLGLRSYKNGRITMRALKFRGLRDQAKSKTTITSPKDSNGSWVGEIVVTFHEYIELEGYYDEKECESKWRGSQKSLSDIKGNKEKLVKSGQGTTVESEAKSPKKKNIDVGKILETITVKYCTTVELIHAGVLPKPPYWNWARLNFPDAGLNNNAPALEPEILTFAAATTKDGKVIGEAKNVEMFDLTASNDELMSDSDTSNCCLEPEIITFAAATTQDGKVIGEPKNAELFHITASDDE